MVEARIAFCLLALLALAGCGSYTTSAAVRLTDGQTLVGSTTAAATGGVFSATGSLGLACRGTYDPFDRSPTITAPVTCNDGRVGIIRVTRTADGLSGGGTVQLSDGSTGVVGFGSLASTVLNIPPPAVASPANSQSRPASLASFPSAPSVGRQELRSPNYGACDCPYDRNSNGDLCGASSAYSRPGGYAPACYAGDPSPSPAIALGCAENGSCYGDISAATGRPKTVHVGGYYRKNGTYVRGHYRSKRR